MGSTRALAVVVVLAFAAGSCGGGGGGGNGTTDPPADPTPITVSGTVIHERSAGVPVAPDAGVSVAIVGHPTVVTDGAGRFTVPDVETPYDAIVFDAARGEAVVYLGLARADPVLEGTRPGASVLRSTWALGTVTGGAGWPPPAAHETAVSFGNVDRESTGQVNPQEADGSYGYALSWSGPSTIHVTGAALQWHQGLEGPSAYTGFGTVSADVTHGVNATGLTIPLAAVNAEPVSGTLEAAPGLGTVFGGLLVRLDAGPRLYVWLGNRAPGAFGALVPDLPQATLWIELGASAPTGEDVFVRRIVAPGASGLAFTFPEPVLHVQPADGATGVTQDTVFGATTPVDGVVRVRYTPVFPSDGPYVVLVTAGTTWTVPDLSPYGVLVPGDATYAWELTGFGPAAVDDLCDATPFTSRPSHYEARAGWREITTAP